MAAPRAVSAAMSTEMTILKMSFRFIVQVVLVIGLTIDEGDESLHVFFSDVGPVGVATEGVCIDGDACEGQVFGYGVDIFVRFKLYI